MIRFVNREASGKGTPLYPQVRTCLTNNRRSGFDLISVFDSGVDIFIFHVSKVGWIQIVVSYNV